MKILVTGFDPFGEIKLIQQLKQLKDCLMKLKVQKLLS